MRIFARDCWRCLAEFLIFEQFMHKHLPDASDFEAFYQAFMQECHAQIGEVLEAISISQKRRAQFRPNPVRTLLVDDCIERGKDFNAGGARYYWSVVNLAGMINVLDSLLVIRELVFTVRRMSGKELLERLEAGDTFLEERKVVRFGTDEAQANAMAERLSTDLCAAFEGKKPISEGNLSLLPFSLPPMWMPESTWGQPLTGVGRERRCATPSEPFTGMTDVVLPHC